MLNYRKTYEAWLSSGILSSEEMSELSLAAEDEKELESRFFGMLEFGTAGLRGVMGVGLNRMNIHVVRHTTQALCMMISENPGKDKSIAICYDSRHNSREYAKAAAEVAAANGIIVRIFDDLRPTPELSFAIREYGCTAGINITASHNTKEYSGYKVYWSDGAQLPPDNSAVVYEKMAQLDMFSVCRMDYEKALKDGLIIVMGEKTDELFLENVMAQVCDTEAVKKAGDEFKLVYTPFHGAGAKLIPEVFKRIGIRNVFCVAEQMEPDGSFPTVASPNPENPEGFALAIKLAEEHKAGLIIGTDPDADRVGVMAKKNEKFQAITGNQTGVLLLDYIIGAKKRANTMPPMPVTLKTIVTTEMARRVAEENGVVCHNTFTGFKFMAEKKNALESSGEGTVIFSFEESYGYMIGDFVRDKDAVTASMLIAEMGAWYHAQGMTLFDALDVLYEKYGRYEEKTLNLIMSGLDGPEKMRLLMNNLRSSPPADICGVPVTSIKDYECGEEIDISTGNRCGIELKGSNLLSLSMEDGSIILVRPSGTEPKVKVYIMVSGDDADSCAVKLQNFSAWAEKM